MFFDPKPVNPWHSKKENVPGVFYRLPRLANRAASVSSSFPSEPRLGGSRSVSKVADGRQGRAKSSNDPIGFTDRRVHAVSVPCGDDRP